MYCIQFQKYLMIYGSCFKEEGLDWIYEIIKRNENLNEKELVINTVYYMERYIGIYIDEKREIIKKDISIRKKVLTILDFLVNKGSTISYMIRELL